MKKLVLLMLSLLICGSIKANALTFEEALNQSKPMALFIYADWADDVNPMMQNFKSMEEQYGNKYNFILMNIADEQTKAFNKHYHIYPNMPYVLLFRDRGRISRFLPKNCVDDVSCFSQKLDLFNN